MPTRGLDPSWQFALNEAAGGRLPFGDTIVFTGGPASAFVTTAFDPRTYGWMLVMSLAVAVVILASVAQSFGWGPSSMPRALLVILIMAGLGDREGLLLLAPVLSTLALARAQHRVAAALAMTGLSAVAAIDALAKGSMFPLVILSCLVAFGITLLRGWRLLAVASLVLPVTLFVLMWVAMGQRIGSVPHYFRGVVELAQGYTEAMSWGSPREDVALFLVVVLVGACSSVVLSQASGPHRMQRLGVALVSAFTVFTASKLGFVRADMHMLAGFSCALGLAALAMALSSSPRGRMGVTFSLAALTAAVLTGLGAPWLYLIAPVHQDSGLAGIAAATRRALGFDASLDAQRQSAIAEIVATSDVPPLVGSVDIYSYDQADVIARRLDWSTRPVLQSYSAYTPWLSELNRKHLTGSNAPNWVLFTPQSIDGRYPSIEDGSSWPDLLGGYRPEGFAGEKVVLRKAGSVATEPVSLGAAKAIELGRRQVLSQYPGMRYVQIRTEATFLGKAALLLYKTSPLRITVWTADGAKHRYRLPAGLAASGFLLSPLTSDAAQFASLYGGDSADPARRVTSFRVDGSAYLWSTNLVYREAIIPSPGER